MSKKIRHIVIFATIAAAAVAGWFFADNMWLLAAYPGWIGSIILGAMILPTWGLFLKRFGARGVITGFLLLVGGLAIEALAVKTGWPYGGFAYGGFVEPTLFGLPVAVPFLWGTLVIGVWWLVSQTTKRGIPAFVLGVLSLLLVDVTLDPPAVAMGIWSWDKVGLFYGVPLQNFAGWILSGAVGVGLLSGGVDLVEIKDTSAWMASGVLWTTAFWLGTAVFFTQWWAVLAGVVVLAMFAQQMK
jgi:putative membrane protein